MFETILLLIVALPLIGFVVTAALGRRLGIDAWVIPVGIVVASWVLGMIVAFTALTGYTPGSVSQATSISPSGEKATVQRACRPAASGLARKSLRS